MLVSENDIVRTAVKSIPWKNNTQTTSMKIDDDVKLIGQIEAVGLTAGPKQ